MADPTVSDAIEAAAGQYGLNPAMLKGIASIESSWDPQSNRNRATQYKGLFQIGPDEWKQYGAGGDIYNPVDNANAAAHMLADHAQWYKGQYGSEPTPGKTYMMHLQGRGFVSNGTMTNVAGNPYPGMRGPQTPETFERGWSDRLDRAMAPFGGATSIYASGGAPAPNAVPTPSPAVALAQAQPSSAPYFAGAAGQPTAATAPAASSGTQATAAADIVKLGEGLLAPQLGAPPKLQLPAPFRPNVPQLKSLATIKPSIYFPQG